MRQTVDPDFEFDRRPVLWGAIAVVILGFAVNFLLNRPLWLVLVALVGGGVAAARSDFYEVPANNGAVAAVLGTLALIPFLAFARVSWLFGIEGSGDTLFLSAVLGLAWVAIVLIVLAPLGYVGGMLVDMIRRRIGGPIGY
ncbi:hypothetical protein C483_11116 [Natrialba hulunbeirensis JCM 10989]|uniref:Uncharacterized protein n=1 Tax=Natrialba hulunbeirensis JCM 10989 TaxID=1227493 RepID=L9ZX25_9EURY|nr:DUF5518 domain-containing protein [Natrialba hulunbeirensis]ELY90606.1 hypothetical protein C483_11116 [Natrialba hulunbeirensis JCM 10989]